MLCQTHDALPRPSYARDMPLTALRTAELLLLQTLRLWVAGAMYQQHDLQAEAALPAPPDWRGGLEAAGLNGGSLRSFDALWRLLAAAPLRQLEVRRPACPRLSRDEGWFLQALQRVQAQDMEQAEAILRAWLPPAGLRLAVVPLTGLVEGLSRSGLLLPQRNATASDLPPPAPHITHCPDPGMALLH